MKELDIAKTHELILSDLKRVEQWQKDWLISIKPEYKSLLFAYYLVIAVEHRPNDAEEFHLWLYDLVFGQGRNRHNGKLEMLKILQRMVYYGNIYQVANEHEAARLAWAHRNRFIPDPPKLLSFDQLLLT